MARCLGVHAVVAGGGSAKGLTELCVRALVVTHLAVY